ncbi:MAG: HsdR family type I site-specific deoxyribonuclease [Roseiflexaceae bacterium]
MTLPNAYREAVSSQIPAAQLLLALGWQYLTPDEALALRAGRQKNVVLTGVLEPWLRANNQIEARGQRLAFSDANIRLAVERLVDEPFQSLILTSERLYELLTLGTSLTQTVDGDRKSFTLRYIDWERPERNHYHICEEFVVERRGSRATRRPDLVLFVNGIPLAVIECKRPDLDSEGEQATAEAISQMLRNQAEGEIPHLFAYSQLLVALSGNDARYATTGTPKTFWSRWREEGGDEAAVQALINTPLPAEGAERLYAWRDDARALRRHFATLGPRLPTEQDRLLAALLRPARLLELAYQFIVYDDGVKKIARYQQYFAIKATLGRVAQLNAQGTRTGGVIWHTTGSGKSLTMVMLAKALALHPAIASPRVVLVTDRVDLDTQIYKTFRACGKSVVQAEDGEHLARLVAGRLRQGEPRGDVITTVINKFDQAARRNIRDQARNVFVLVDESHRSQYGTMNAKMQQVFPNACLIGFTGTPLTRGEKSTARRFGDFIHTYPMRQAVADQAVVPLLYEGRVVELDVDKAQLERWFERTTRHLSDAQKADLKRRMSSGEAVNATEQRIKEIAYNIAQHYEQHWRGQGFKAQLATASKQAGLKYLRYLRAEGIDAALVISPPDTREGHSDVGEEPPEVQQFWKQMMDRYGDETAYLRETVASFGRADGVELLIVVDKLLTGFDEPRNTVLYIDKPLKEHTLLQAIARVNRLAEGKDYGYIIDYRGVLGELNEALNLYDALAQYDAEDIAGTFSDVAAEIARLPQLHSDLWAVFEGVANKRDIEAMQRHLEPEDRRQHFYDALAAYARTLKVALAAVSFYETTPAERVQRYKEDLRTFHNLRQAVKLRYAEAVDYRDYEQKVRKLMDEHIRATGTSVIIDLVNVFDAEKFDAEVARLDTPTAKADTILNRMKRTISERMDEDPAYYRRFSELVEETILAYRQGRIDQLEYLNRAQRYLDQIRSGGRAALPEQLARYRHAPAYYGVLREQLAAYGLSDERIADIAIQHETIIEASKITDWGSNLDVQKKIKRQLDHQLGEVEREAGVEFDLDQLDRLIDQVLEVAKARDQRGV